MRFNPGNTDKTGDDKRRLYIFSAVPVLSFLVFIIALFSLQIIKGPAYALRAKTNREQFSILSAIRGIIYDRSGEEILAYNRRSFAVSIVPQNLPYLEEEKEIILDKLAILLKMDKSEILQIMEGKAYSRYGSYVLKTDVPFKDIVFLAEHNRDFPGVYWKSKPVRVYPYDDMLSHVLGYVGMISEKELLELADKGYNLESVIGKSGIEKIYDIELKGKDGFVRRIVDATNQVSAEIIDKGAEPVPGNYVVLTIDKDIQAKAEMALDKRIGAVVVSKPSTGEILALVSYPGYDPNLFISQRDKDFFKNLTLDKRKPFLNRAIQAQYPAGSIFKLVVALGILDSGKVPPEKEYVCNGGYKAGNRFFSCWSNHGSVDLYNAIVFSCDSYFYQASLALGPEAIYQYSRDIGFGEKLGIDLIGELDGIIPNPEWKREVKGDIWYDGDTLNLAIGQGFLLVTPLQLNALTNLIANRGVLMKPHLVTEVYSAKSDEILYRRSSDILVNSSIGKEDFNFIVNAMRGVITDGTAKWGGAILSSEAAGKTSTAEIVGQETHSWYTAFAPYITDDPGEMISVTAIVEHGGAGSVNAARIVSEIIESIFANVGLEEARINIWKKRIEISTRGTPVEIGEPADL
jgi:penicillin-binding protein 2